MILHVDMDAFYASVEERDDPALARHPVVVGGSADGRGVVMAANYQARAFGVHSAMSAAQARRLCPHAVVVKPRMAHYAAVSRQIRAIFEQFTPLVEPLSLDEAFLDVTASQPIFGPSPTIGRRIQERIRAEVGLVASVGVAANKFLAKIASDLQKPNGFVVIEPGGEQAFLDPLPVGRIWGVGKVTGRTFARLGIATIGELRSLPIDRLRELFGASGEHYGRLARGFDERRVVPDREAKSISHETTFAADLRAAPVLRGCLVELIEQVARRLRRHQRKGRSVELKVRFSDFRTITRSRTLEPATDVTHDFVHVGLDLLAKLPADHLPIRLLGFGVHHLEDVGATPIELFAETDRQRTLDQVADRIAERFGKAGLRRATGLSEK